MSEQCKCGMWCKMSESKFPPTAVKHEGLGNGGRGEGGRAVGKNCQGDYLQGSLPMGG